MPYEIVMPRLGWNMEEGTLVEWLKQDGEKISQGEMVCTIEGDKAATDVESFESGILKIPDASPKPGQTVPVGTLLGFIVSEVELETFDPNKIPADVGTGESGAAGPGDAIEPGHGPAGIEKDGSRANAGTAGTATGTAREQDMPAISPRARRAAQASGVAWRSLKGSGRSGRIVERDVLAAARKHEIEVDGADKKGAAVQGGQSDLRRVIAYRMAEAHRTTAPVTLNTEVDVTMLSSYLQDTFRPSWYDLMVRISAEALAEHPVMNATWRDGVVLNDGIHIGIAVDTSAGVIAPVIRYVPAKSLQDI